MVRDVASSGPTIAIPESSEIANLAVVERDDRIVFPLMDTAKPFHSTKWLLFCRFSDPEDSIVPRQ